MEKPVIWSVHARQRADERCSLRLSDIERIVRKAVKNGTAYQPSMRVAKTPGEVWVKCDGPKGRATAVVDVTPRFLHIITIREAETVGQGERASEPLKARLGDLLRSKEPT